ncbi:MAG TPA: C40 family peptidase [Pyrinomonadaceae bacterium]|jgi:cell wall-associated NlpC family hydrolase|nr:C40 family peptidase [Pyrinomonadaceae bacterium]
MSVKTLFPRALVASFALCLFANGAAAQETDQPRPRQVTQATQQDGSNRLENDVFVVSEATPASVNRYETELAKPRLIAPRLFQFNQMMMAAIDTRIGAPYVYGTEGPRVFDCSGFVWSVFQSAGVQFERGSARNFWANFNPVSEDEKYKFGTLVFFNNLKHVGIVADANGFYHASTSQGVTYSPFNEYWTSRITGFRRVPLSAQTLAD